ncbi:MAG: 50S ribosomal protein L32 [Gammaproteobacteria bacterium]|nr:50S ribosomal protein L32 [Gammaproteobacteria bacterium]
MAVQKSKKSRSRRDMRRSHHGAKAPAYSTDATTGELHLRHNITPGGFYRGKQVVTIKVKDTEQEEEES